MPLRHCFPEKSKKWITVFEYHWLSSFVVADGAGSEKPLSPIELSSFVAGGGTSWRKVVSPIELKSFVPADWRSSREVVRISLGTAGAVHSV